MEIHAQLLEQILQGAFLVRPDWAVGAEILFALLVGIGLRLVAADWRVAERSVRRRLDGDCVRNIMAPLHARETTIDSVYPWAVITLVYPVASLLGYLRTEAR